MEWSIVQLRVSRSERRKKGRREEGVRKELVWEEEEEEGGVEVEVEVKVAEEDQKKCE